MKKMKIIKKLDIVIIGILLVISFAPYLMIKGYQNSYKGKVYAVISVNGEEQDKIILKEGKELDNVLESEYGMNRIVIHDEIIEITESDCADAICVHQGSIEKVGEKIVCLPNKLVIEIRGEKKSNNTEEDVISR